MAVNTIAAYSGARVRQGGRPFVLDEIMRSPSASIAPPPNSPLVRGLLLADIECNFDSPKFEGLRLNAADLGSIVFGHRWHGRGWEEGLEYGMSIAIDGTAAQFGAWGKGAGTVRLNGNQLCFESTSTVFCGNVLRHPGGTKAMENEYLWFDVWATPFSLVE